MDFFKRKYTSAELKGIDVNYQKVGFTFDHTEEEEEHECLTCGRITKSEFCSEDCHERRFY